jgi:hypothetical protein
VISSIDGGTVKIMGRVPGSPAPKEITVEVGPKVEVTRYNPENGKYEASKLATAKTGDQLRVLGEKSADGTSIKATDVGVGTFKSLGVVVKSVDTAANTVTGIDSGTKQTVTIKVLGDTKLHRFNDTSAMMVARQLNPTYQQAGGRGARGGGAPGGDGAAAGGPPAGAGGPPAGMAGGRGPGGPGGGGRGRGGMDVGKIIEQQPTITLADLKAGDALIASVALGSDSSKMFAIGLVAGADPVLRATANSGPDPLAGSWNMGGGGGGEP